MALTPKLVSTTSEICSHRSQEFSLCPPCSQNILLSKSDKASSQAEEAAIEDLLPQGDFSVLTPCFDSGEVPARFIIESSRSSAVIAKKTEQLSKPHVPISVEELSLVSKLDCWSNCNVRVLGTLSPIADSDHVSSDLWSLESVGEEGGPFSILVDTKLVKEHPPTGIQVQVFGEIQLLDGSRPVVLMKFFRNFSSVDLHYYKLASEKVNEYVSCFIRQVGQNMAEDSD